MSSTSSSSSGSASSASAAFDDDGDIVEAIIKQPHAVFPLLEDDLFTVSAMHSLELGTNGNQPAQLKAWYKLYPDMILFHAECGPCFKGDFDVLFLMEAKRDQGVIPKGSLYCVLMRQRNGSYHRIAHSTAGFKDTVLTGFCHEMKEREGEGEMRYCACALVQWDLPSRQSTRKKRKEKA